MKKDEVFYFVGIYRSLIANTPSIQLVKFIYDIKVSAFKSV